MLCNLFSYTGGKKTIVNYGRFSCNVATLRTVFNTDMLQKKNESSCLAFIKSDIEFALRSCHPMSTTYKIYNWVKRATKRQEQIDLT